MTGSNTWRKLYRVVDLTLFQSQILGLITFSFSKNGVEKSILKCLYNVIAISVYIPSTVISVMARFNANLFFVFKTTDIIQMVVSLIYVTTAWLNGILYQKKYIEILSKLTEFDVSFHQLGYKIDYEHNRRQIKIHIYVKYVITAISFVGQIYTYTFPKSQFVFLTYIVYYFPIIMNLGVCVQSLTYIHLVKYRLAIINDQIYDLTKDSECSYNTVSTVQKALVGFKHNRQLTVIHNACLLHHQLTQIINLFNETFGITLLATFGVSFINIIVGLYYCSNSLRSNSIDWILIINCVLLSVTFAIDANGICYSCHATIEEVKKAGVLIHKIETNNPDVKYEIEMFSLQIANEQVEFNAAGFFPINYTLLFSIIGGVTTYIIILIQMSNK